MRRFKTLMAAALIGSLAALTPETLADAGRIADVTRLDGQRETQLTGVGLVVGLDGTGDGGDFLPAIRPLAAMLEKFNMGANVLELNDVDNVALVNLSATVPAAGVRNGDKLDVFVQSIGAAKSLRGGRLVLVPMKGPNPNWQGVLALAGGNVILEDPSTATAGRVRGGAVMEADLTNSYVVGNRFTLILDNAVASVGLSTAIAKVINDAEDGRPIAVAVDAKNVVVTIPAAERGNANNLIARIQRLPLPPVDDAARVTINNRTGTIVLSGDVGIEPTVISHKGLTITTVDPEPVPSVARPQVTDRDFIAIDPQNKGGSKLQDLLASLDQLKVPAEERIAIVKELHRSGALRAELIEE